MEEGQSLFTLSVDAVGKLHLKEAGKWARFLAILGMIFLGLMLIGVITGVSTALQSRFISSRYGYNETVNIPDQVRIFAIAYTVVVALIGFFPLLFLLQFGNKAKAAVATDNQTLLTECFQSLKKHFRFIGVLTIIFLVLFILGIALTGMSFFMMR